MRKLTISQDRGILVGLDIGTTKICCIIAQQSTNDGLKLLGAGIGSSAAMTILPFMCQFDGFFFQKGRCPCQKRSAGPKGPAP